MGAKMKQYTFEDGKVRIDEFCLNACVIEEYAVNANVIFTLKIKTAWDTSTLKVMIVNSLFNSKKQLRYTKENIHVCIANISSKIVDKRNKNFEEVYNYFNSEEVKKEIGEIVNENFPSHELAGFFPVFEN